MRAESDTLMTDKPVPSRGMAKQGGDVLGLEDLRFAWPTSPAQIGSRRNRPVESAAVYRPVPTPADLPAPATKSYALTGGGSSHAEVNAATPGYQP